MEMLIECFIIEGCVSEEQLKKNIYNALKETGVNAEVQFRRITAEEAISFGIKGSPTVLINGVDIVKEEDTSGSS
jgi:hypothetical protein